MGVTTVRYRPGWRQLPWPTLLCLLPAIRLAGHWPLRAALVLASLALVLRARAWGLTLAPDALHLHGPYRTRSIRWPQVAEIKPTRRWGSNVVEIRTTTGRRVRPRAPFDAGGFGPDPDYFAKVDTIVGYWRERAASPERTPTPAGSAP